VRGNGESALRTITDPAEVKRIVAFVEAHSSGWAIPWFDVPIPELVVELYDGEEFKGHFGAGLNFFETHRSGDFLSKYATPEERDGFYRLIGVEPVHQTREKHQVFVGYTIR
jgi:hypothetical protein